MAAKLAVNDRKSDRGAQSAARASSRTIRVDGIGAGPIDGNITRRPRNAEERTGGRNGRVRDLTGYGYGGLTGSVPAKYDVIGATNQTVFRIEHGEIVFV